jgi:hypothetical protein
MKAWGWVIAAFGVIYLIIALNMDVSVSTSSTYVPGYGSVGGGEVANLDLMARRQNHVIVASLITLIGTIIGIFGKSTNEVSEAKPTVTPSIKVDFEGERDLSLDGYRLWLANTYGIARNEVFDRFVMGEQTFESLDDALLNAHASEQEKLRQAEELRAAAEARAAERRAKNEALAEEAAAEWERNKPKVIAVSIIVAVVAVGAFFALKETPEEREARLVKEAAEESARLTKIEDDFNIVLPEGAENVISQHVNDYGFICSERSSETTLLEFNSNSSEEEIRDGFSKSLGEGEPAYSYIEDPGNWKWVKDGTEWTLTIFGSEVGREQNEVNLCMWKASNSGS